ncbi:MAG: hypothetical protein QG572_1888, partial [Pseudomonadota bacterium]|nr:hypothetical protein [Pseudomonadota bacterium]
ILLLFTGILGKVLLPIMAVVTVLIEMLFQLPG